MCLTRFERFDEPVVSGWEFFRRISKRLLGVLGVIVLLMLLGAYLFYPDKCEKDCFSVALHNAATPLSGMGPAGGERGEIGEKLLVDFYALFCGLALAVAFGLLLAPPVFHRVIHHSHGRDKEATSSAATPPDADA